MFKILGGKASFRPQKRVFDRLMRLASSLNKIISDFCLFATNIFLIEQTNYSPFTMTHNSGQKRKALVASVALALAASLAISPGMAAIAESEVMTQDLQDATDPNLDIKQYGISGGKAYIQVYGTAGGTLADHEHAVAYVINVLTTDGVVQTWAIDSHEKQHGDTATGEEWHAHRVTVVDGCVNEVDQVNHAMVEDKRATFENMVVRGSSGNSETVGVAKVLSALTVELHVLVDDPDNPPVGTKCIAVVSKLYDSAPL